MDNKRRNALTALAFVIFALFTYIMINGLPAKDPVDDAAGYFSITIDCSCLVEELDLLPKEKRYLVPADGILLTVSDIPFREGESVFDATLRVAQASSLHMEFQEPTAYSNAYVEAFGNLYEFDAGELSGWTLLVNGEYPNVGCSAIALANGDLVEWRYAVDRYEE